jgi:aryl-alcohol dehydrogenase (NADP+)
MDYRNLGRSGVKVSPLCLGTMMFGGPTDEADSRRIVDRAREQGVNFIDTADVYTDGRSEEIVGRAIKAQRDWWVLATKFANPTQDGPNGRGASRRYIFRAVEDSLRRLDTPVIDILYIHREDLATPLEETVRALETLVRDGKIRYFGVSNFRAWRVAAMSALCDQAGIDRPVASQPLYNALNRAIETEHVPACAHLGIGVVPYSPLARGVLTGKYAPGEAPSQDTRAGRADKRIMETEWRPESLAIARTLADHARARGITPGQFAVAWVLHNAAVSSAIAGPRTMEQWQDYEGALRYAFTPEDEALVDGLVTPGHASTPGYNDPAYPIEGRVVRRP